MSIIKMKMYYFNDLIFLTAPCDLARHQASRSVEDFVQSIWKYTSISTFMTLNAETTIQFIRRIEEAYPTKRKIHVFCDNASYYRNNAVRPHLDTSRVKLHFLPPYSPDLNPIERLWKWMKERVIYNTYYEYFEEFRAAVVGFFAVLSTMTEESKLGQTLRSRVRDKFSPIGTPAANFCIYLGIVLTRKVSKLRRGVNVYSTRLLSKKERQFKQNQ